MYHTFNYDIINMEILIRFPIQIVSELFFSKFKLRKSQVDSSLPIIIIDY